MSHGSSQRSSPDVSQCVIRSLLNTLYLYLLYVIWSQVIKCSVRDDKVTHCLNPSAQFLYPWLDSFIFIMVSCRLTNITIYGIAAVKLPLWDAQTLCETLIWWLCWCLWMAVGFNSCLWPFITCFFSLISSTAVGEFRWIISKYTKQYELIWK